MVCCKDCYSDVHLNSNLYRKQDNDWIFIFTLSKPQSLDEKDLLLLQPFQ